MNVIEIDAASNNGVDNIRDIKENVQYPPTEGRYKVYIIDEVHMLSVGAFNALLKTLDHPVFFQMYFSEDAVPASYSFVMVSTICAVSTSDVPLSILHFWI